MNNRSLYGIIAVIVIVIVGAVIYAQSNKTQAPTAVESTAQSLSKANPESDTPTNTQDQTIKSDESAIMDSEAKIHEISFSGTAYVPANITIKNGDIVVFKNDSDKDFWPASAPHPQHTNYPEFDAKAKLAPGKIFEFKFTKPGKWLFHDHILPSAYGGITVE